MNTNEALAAIAIPKVSSLSVDEQRLLDSLGKVWREKRERNSLRMTYYDGKNRLHDLGISIPPKLRSVETVVGWPAKAVDVLAVRSILDGFTSTKQLSSILAEIVDGNSLNALYAQALPAELIHSCAFLTVSKGDIAEAPAVISVYSAFNASALWNYRKKRIEAGFAITEVNDKKQITAFNLYTSACTIECTQIGKSWQVNRMPHLMGRPLMEPLRYRPTLDRPFGKSRISRSVMSITDSAVRAALRSEIASEFYTSPQKYLLGASDEAIDEVRENKWLAYIGTIFAMGVDEDGTMPHFGQLPQMTMQPHVEYGCLYGGFIMSIDLITEDWIIEANNLFLLLTTGAIGALFRVLWQVAKKVKEQQERHKAIEAEAAEQERKFRYATLHTISLQICLIYEQVLAGAVPSELVIRNVIALHKEYGELGGNGVVDRWVERILEASNR